MYQKRVFFDVGTIRLDGSCVDLYSLEMICRDGGKFLPGKLEEEDAL